MMRGLSRDLYGAVTTACANTATAKLQVEHLHCICISSLHRQKCLGCQGSWYT